MSLHPLDVAAVVGYFLLMVVLGFLTRRTKTFKEFAVGRRSIPVVMIFASLSATIVGPGFSIGVTSKSWTMGFAFYLVMLTYAAQTLLTGFLFGPRLTQERDCSTLGEVMKKRYGKFTQFLTGVLSAGLCIGFTAVMGKIGASILQDITNWPWAVCLVAVTGTTALLTFTGGLRATIATEAVQFSLKAIIVPLMLLLAVYKSSSSIAQMSQQASAVTRTTLAGMGGWQVLGLLVSFAFGEMLIPPYANRALAAKDEATSRSGFLSSGVFIVMWLAIVAAIGAVAHGVVAPDTKPDDVFIAVGKAVLPSGLFGLLLAAIVAIVMSSQESVLNSAAVAFVRDGIGAFSRPDDKRDLLFVKISTLCIAVLAIFAAQVAPSIIDGLLILYSIWAPTILVPLIAGLYLKNPRPLASWLSILGGAMASLGCQFTKEAHDIPAILAGLLVAGVCYVAGHLIGKSNAKTVAVSAQAI